MKPLLRAVFLWSVMTAALAPVAARASFITFNLVGASPGFSGQMTLDAISSNDGSLSDIDSLTLTTPGGTYTFNPADSDSINYYQSGVYNEQLIPFTWNSHEITEMDLLFDYDFIAESEPVYFADIGVNAPVYDFPSNFEYSLSDYVDYNFDFAGKWVAVATPDQTSTLILLGLALVAGGGAELWQRKRSGRRLLG